MHPQSESIFWIAIDKISPNPYQPRHQFDEEKLNGLAESIRQYGILQPLVVTRHETEKEDGGISVTYELIAGERRLRASRIAGLTQVPALIKSIDNDDQLKLELAIIENLQREDLNPVDRAKAFAQLTEEFKFKHSQIAKRIGKSREYVSNSLRLLSLPKSIIDSISDGIISEGHARPLMMLGDRPDEQDVLYREIILKKLTVRDAESIARRIAFDKIRKKDRLVDPEFVVLEEELEEVLNARVQIERRDSGGRITINFYSPDELHNIIETINNRKVDYNKAENIITQNSNNNDNINKTLKNDDDTNSNPEQKNDKIEDSEDLMYDIKKFSL